MEAPEGPRRLTIEERAARREQVLRRSGDRYSSLLHALRAGREIEAGRRRRTRLRWHPVAGRLLRVAVVGVFIVLALTTGVRYVRERQVDTWTGPTNGVTSGQQLAGCAGLTSGYDPSFPRWVRIEGRLYVDTGSIRPMGYGASAEYPDTGYALGDLRLHRVGNTPEGEAGNSILVRIASVPTGELYVRRPECE